MKIAISYPPLESSKGVPLLSQNRQFQWFSDPTYIYPMVPALAATLLKAKGFEVLWDDAIAQGLTQAQWLGRLKREKPDLIAMESKTPVIKRHWRLIDRLKEECTWEPKLVLFGDHATALPEECMLNSRVDYVITGGDYDFVLSELAAALSGASVPILPEGVWSRGEDGPVTPAPARLNHDLNQLPSIDRELTQWRLYAYRNGNFKYRPGTYVMAGRDCWWGRCSFCSWTTLYPGRTYRTVDPQRHLDEIGRLIADYRVREIFDDSGCFPKGGWLEQFCRGVIKSGYQKRIRLGCNMRVGALSAEQWRLMRRAGFRFILIGLESVNQDTLDRLNKGVAVSQIEQTITDCKKAGLEPHITIMVGYPWETMDHSRQTIAFARRLFSRGCIDTLQATMVVPYPGTPLFEEARSNGWLTTQNWDDYDMKQSVWKSPVSNADVLSLTQELYKAALSPGFIIRKLGQVRRASDLLFIARAARKLLAHVIDFRHKSD